jgi:hypothetical protein
MEEGLRKGVGVKKRWLGKEGGEAERSRKGGSIGFF